MSTEEAQSAPDGSPATEVSAPADKQEESMDTNPPPSSESSAGKTEPENTESSQTVPKDGSEKVTKSAQPVIKPPVPKTIQDRPSKQSIEQMEEAKLKAKFGGLQKPGGSQFLQKRLNKGQMKYFDSGDYMMAKQSGKLKIRPASGKPGIPQAQQPKPTGEAIPTVDSIHHRKPSSEISKLAV
ncbi:alpha-endosulfine-like isoform X1 [Diadema setosum]|uniref:alpha-endosulfine-like isoform X1 n=1 Tax=Diadema setosum TaxID=31175 RepID=UPI003B3AA249